MRRCANERLWDERRLADPHGQPDKAARVRAMFDTIAPTYELVNRVLSAGRDAYWRRRAVQLARVCPSDRILDIGCGTGDFARAFSAASPERTVGCDFSLQMLRLAPARGGASVDWCQADALRLPFADESFTLTGCAFSVRNFGVLAAGLSEMHRVLTPRGRAVILEFSMPRTAAVRYLYSTYCRRLLPRLARWISRDRTGAYDYLPRSVSSFVDAAGMREALSAAGFKRVEDWTLTGGIVTVFVAWKT